MIVQRLFPVVKNVFQHLNSETCKFTSFLTSRPLLTKNYHTFGLPSAFITQKNILNGKDFTRAAVVPANIWSLNASRTNIRIKFPRPNERKRVTKFGWFARMKTPGGRAILMRRILKGRHVLSH